MDVSVIDDQKYSKTEDQWQISSLEKHGSCKCCMQDIVSVDAFEKRILYNKNIKEENLR